MSPEVKTTEAQLIANLENSLRSTGPRTEEGKAKARYNARRHGLTGQFYAMDENDRKAYLVFEQGLFKALAPVGEYEQQLAVSIAQDHWRINRARGIEFNTMGLGHNEQAGDILADSAETETAVALALTWQADPKGFANIALYETRLHRIINRNKKELDDLQTKRKAAEAQAREEAELLLAYEVMQGKKLDQSQPVEANGFVFSAPELLRNIARRQALQEARWYQLHNWDRTKRHTPRHLNLPKAA